MARLTTLQKQVRMLKLLSGMRIPRVAQQLAPFGLDAGTMEEGWAYLKEVTGGPFEPLPARPPEVRPVPELDAFENLWFPIARRTLDHRYPQITANLFVNLPRTRGIESAFALVQFLDRLARMARGEEPFGADGPAARELLAKRGLTPEREAAAWQLLDKLRAPEPERLPRVAVAREERAAEAMWAWYLEWSTIARHAIKNKALLRALGFSPPRTQRRTEQEPQSDVLPIAGESQERPPPQPARTTAAARPLARAKKRTKRKKD